jgi:predicted flap endonuclease-1-like 5' DNA nuclease
VLERAFSEAKATPPAVDLRLDTLLAALQVPLKFVTNRLEDAADRREVERMYAELKSTGRVEATLGPAERSIRALKAAEVEPALAEARKIARASFLQCKPEPVPLAPQIERAPEPATPARSYLGMGDDIERAPSIGPKMAERLGAMGLARVSDLLAADPSALAAILNDRRIDAATIGDWQDQSRLMIEVPGLRGGHAQLLVGAGFRTHAALAAADAQGLCAKVLAFAATAEGRRILRDGDPPDVARIMGWAASARRAQAA